MLRPLFILACAVVPPALAQDPPIPTPEESLKSLAVAPGLRVQLWASEPLVENPVAFSFDHLGRAYVVETNRRRSSTPDIRRNESWVPAILSHRTVADRVAFIEKEFAPEKKLFAGPTRPDLNRDGQFDWRDLTVESERIRVLEDSNGDGLADKARVLAEGFNTLATGSGAGVLPLPPGNDGGTPGGVLFTCVPDLWLIYPDGTKFSLSTGYGVHVAYSGHDLHALRIGPDGRLYFSIGDTGANVTGHDGRRVEMPDCGSVFRCWPDGTGLELFVKGVRNPQHLAFNDVGDLFTGDNNADGADEARLLHLVQGADYGWRIGWQFLPNLGAWNSEGMWRLNAGETNAFILPPIAYVGHGPAGFSYYPGTGLPEKYRGHFFMADFPGGVRDFALKPKGATYELDGFAPDAPVVRNNLGGEMTGKLLWNLYPSDVQFPPGGGVMVLDWVQGWEKTNKGRIFRLFAPELEKDPLIAETKQLLAEGMAKRPAEELAQLLGHADQRVRQAAQFALVNRGAEGQKTLAGLALADRGLATLHAIWGLGQCAAREQKVGDTLETLLSSAKGEPLAQALRVAFDAPAPLARVDHAVRCLKLEDNPRAQFFAAQALARHRFPGSADALAQFIKAGRPLEPMLRFAVSRALALQCQSSELADLGLQSPEPGKILALLALRQGATGVAPFLKGQPSRVILEAARAIHDAPIPNELPALAATLRTLPAGLTAEDSTLVLRRAVNAAYRLGTEDTAKILAATAVDPALPEPVRLDALEALAQWNTSLGRDRILGVVVPGDGQRKPKDATTALAAVFDTLLKASPAISAAALEAARALPARETEAACLALTGNPAAPVASQAAALRVLDAVDSPKLPEALKIALASKEKPLVDAARRIQVNRSPAEALAQYTAAMKNGTVAEKRTAIETLGRLDQKTADDQIALLLFKVKNDKLPRALFLDVLEAAAKRTDPTVLSMIREWEKMAPKNDPLGPWRECLEGGDAQAGRQIFAEKAETACLRCHAVAQQGGNVGPDLAGAATRHDRAYLLRAIVDPNAEISPGYENVLLTLQDGSIVAGLATSEDADKVVLKNVADGQPQTVQKSAIKTRQKLPSAMPPGLGDALGKHALRDVIEYLATLK